VGPAYVSLLAGQAIFFGFLDQSARIMLDLRLDNTLAITDESIPF
jgi:hypothetical protein